MFSLFLAQTGGLGSGVLPGQDLGSKPEIFGRFFQQLFTLIIIAGALLVLYNLIIAAINWITSNGEKEKVEKARKQITNSLIGLIILMSVWTVYFVFTADILGIFSRDASGNVIFTFPSLFGQ